MMSGFKTPKFEFLWLGVQGKLDAAAAFPYVGQDGSKDAGDMRKSHRL